MDMHTDNKNLVGYQAAKVFSDKQQRVKLVGINK